MKYLGLLAALALCLAVAVPASAITIKDIDFETSGNLMRPGAATVGFTQGAVSGQNGWSNTGTIDASQALVAPGVGVKEVTGYGASWWQDSMGFYCTNGFPYSNVPKAGGIGTVSYDVTLSNEIMAEAGGTSTMVVYARNAWNHEAWEMNIAEGWTRPILGANVQQFVYIYGNGNFKFRTKSGYNGPYLSGLYYQKTDITGTWAGTAGTYAIEVGLDGSGASGISTLKINGVLKASLTMKGPIYTGEMKFKQMESMGGGSANYKPVYDNLLVTQVPEPATMLLLGGGLLFGGLAYRKRR
jgi:hypothetical protein